MKKIKLGLVGATGLVGETILKVLDERDFPLDELYLFSSSRSAGSKLNFRGREYIVEELREESFDRDMDIALFAAGGSVSEKFARLAVDKGIKVIDNSSVFRMEEDVPLIIPEVNPEKIKAGNGLIANPNCSTIQSLVPLKALHNRFKIKRIVYSTYQSVSGSGLAGLRDLEEGLVECYPYQIENNVLAHIDSFLDNGYTKEEVKMIEESKKILDDYSIGVTATTVRVPVKYAHSISVNLEFHKPFELGEVYELLENFPGLVVKDDIKNNIYPMAIDAEGSDDIYVGRIRRDFSLENGLNLWIVADNIRKGAATNTVQIAELVAGALE